MGAEGLRPASGRPFAELMAVDGFGALRAVRRKLWPDPGALIALPSRARENPADRLSQAVHAAFAVMPTERRFPAMTRIVTGLFDNRGDAERTVEHLVQEIGLDAKAVEVHAVAPGEGVPAAGAAAPSLARLGLPLADRATFLEGLRRGGIVVSARVEEGALDRVMDTFEENDAADLDAREEEWRSDGWNAGYTGHDEDIGFATYGQDVVVGRIPRHHQDDMPAGALGRLEITAGDAAGQEMTRHRVRPRVRSFIRGGGDPGRSQS
jgi:hypothetical protein